LASPFTDVLKTPNELVRSVVPDDGIELILPDHDDGAAAYQGMVQFFEVWRGHPSVPESIVLRDGG